MVVAEVKTTDDGDRESNRARNDRPIDVAPEQRYTSGIDHDLRIAVGARCGEKEHDGRRRRYRERMRDAARQHERQGRAYRKTSPDNQTFREQSIADDLFHCRGDRRLQRHPQRGHIAHEEAPLEDLPAPDDVHEVVVADSRRRGEEVQERADEYKEARRQRG